MLYLRQTFNVSKLKSVVIVYVLNPISIGGGVNPPRSPNNPKKPPEGAFVCKNHLDMWMKFYYAHFLKISSPHHVLDRRYGCFVGDRYCFPIHFLYNCIKSRMTLIWVWLMLGTSYSHHRIILVRGMLSDFFVKIPHNDVTWYPYRDRVKIFWYILLP